MNRWLFPWFDGCLHDLVVLPMVGILFTLFSDCLHESVAVSMVW